MVSFRNSTSAGICLQQASNSNRHCRRQDLGPHLQFQLTDQPSTNLLPLKQQQKGSKCRGLLLPLASLTALAQPFQQRQPCSSKGASIKARDSNEGGSGLLNIGLVLQPPNAQQDTAVDPVRPRSKRQQQQDRQQMVVAAAPVPQQHKARHKQHTEPQQVQQTHQQGCALLEAPAAKGTQQPSQQQSKCHQDASGSPIAGWLTLAGQAKLLVAGAASAIVSRTAMAPLERVKMDLLLKTSSRGAVDTAMWVWQREGLAGFWKGNGLNLLRTAPFKALNFFSFDVYSKALSGWTADGNNSTRFIAGAMAGITATLICFPLDVLRTRLMAPWGHKYGGPLTTLKCMVKYEGAGALYAGVVPAVIGMAPSGAVFYGVYDLLKARHLAALNSSSTGTSIGSSSSSTGSSIVGSIQQQQQHLELPVAYSLLYGALAGAAAETFLYPLEVIRRKMQLQSMAAGAAVLASPGNAAAAAASAAPSLLRQHGLKAASGALVPSGAGMGGFGAAGVPGAAFGRLAAACAAIVRADGVAGFYAGLLPNMLQVLPSAALSYGTYETVKQMLGAV